MARNNYQNRGSSRNYDERNYKKKTGAKSGTDKNGKPWVRGWKVMPRGLGIMSFLAAPYSNTHRVTSKSGRNWENWAVKVTPPVGMGKPYFQSGLYSPDKGSVIMPEANIIISPRSRNGGYCGKIK